MHHTASPLAGKTVVLDIKAPHQDRDVIAPSGSKMRVEDWWDRINGGSSWKQDQFEVWAARNYAARIKGTKVPDDDEVVYGKVGGLGYIVHVSEIKEA